MAKEHKHNEECKHEHEHSEHNHEHDAQEQQEMMIKMNMLEQDAKQLEQQLVMIEQQIIELQNLRLALDEFSKANLNDEILAQIGKNIFVKAALLSKDFLVNVGAKTLVKKNIQETQEIIDKDISKMSEVKEQLAKEFERIIIELQSLA